MGDHTSKYFSVQLETLMLKFPLEIIGAGGGGTLHLQTTNQGSSFPGTA